jgi:hypothetical protein
MPIGALPIGDVIARPEIALEHARARCAPWPADSLRTVSISDKLDHSAEPDLSRVFATPLDRQQRESDSPFN